MIETLPEHLLLRTLQAAYSITPPRLEMDEFPGTALGSNEDCAQMRTQATIFSLLDHLPQHMHALPIRALRAASPACDAGALTLPLPVLPTASRISAAVAAEAAAGPPGSGPTSIFLVGCAAKHMTPQAEYEPDELDTAAAGAVPSAIAPLAALTALQDFCVQVPAKTHCLSPQSHVADAFDVALGDVLTRLPRLTSVRMHVDGYADKAHDSLLRGLLALPGLRALALERTCLWDQHADAPSELAAGLRQMTALTHLCLAGTGPGDCGWGVIERAVAARTLRSLDLRDCELDDGLALTGGSGWFEGASEATTERARDAPFGGLRSLRISGNPFNLNELRFLSRLTRLTELDVGWGGPAATHCDILRRVCSPELAKLRYVFQRGMRADEATAVSAPAAAALASAFGDVCARCPRLDTVALTLDGHGIWASVTQILSCLSALPRLMNLELHLSWSRRASSAPTQADVQAHMHADALARCVGLTELVISHNEAAVLCALPSLTALRSLCVMIRESHDCLFRDVVVGVRGLSALVRLTRLHLLGECFVTSVVDDVGRALASLPGMRDFSLDSNTDRHSRASNNNRMRERSIAPVIAVLPRLDLLTKVELNVGCITELDVEELVSVLPQLRGLRFLGVGDRVEDLRRACRHLADSALAGTEAIVYDMQWRYSWCRNMSWCRGMS